MIEIKTQNWLHSTRFIRADREALSWKLNWGGTQHRTWEDIDFLALQGDEKPLPLEALVWEEVADKILPRKIILRQGKSYLSLDGLRFAKEDWRTFLHALQRLWVYEIGSLERRAQHVSAQIQFYEQVDKKIVHELSQNLLDVYESAYRPYTLDIYHKATLDAPDVALHHRYGKKYRYYRRNDFKLGLSTHNESLALQLIRTTEQNILLVRKRILHYSRIRQKIRHTRQELRQRARLEQATQNLRQIQQQLLTHSPKDYPHEAEVLFQLHELTKEVHQLRNLAQSEVLEQQVNVFNEYHTDDALRLAELTQNLHHLREQSNL